MAVSCAGGRVSIVALPDAVNSTLSGTYDVMYAHGRFAQADRYTAPFEIEVVGEEAGRLVLANGRSADVQRAVREVDVTDVVIVSSMLLGLEGWRTGRYPALVAWLRAMHARGALLCSACSGIFLLAETGLFDGKDSPVHFLYADQFRACFPQVRVHPERVLVIAGEREELVCSGASMAWHDLVLYLIARLAGATAAQETARTFSLQWHQDSLAPYIVFQGRRGHGDADIEQAQHWLEAHFSLTRPVETMLERSALSARTFRRRFAEATGLTPLEYIHRLRVEDAKRRLERTDAPVDDVSWRVGYEDPAFFRRLFRRIRGLPPGAYLKRFRIPDFAQTRT